MPPTAISELFQKSGPDGRRVGRRVAAPGLWFAWEPVTTAGRTRRRRRTTSGAQVQVIDVSISGAQVVVPGDAWLRVGTMVRIGMDGGAGTCVIRRAEVYDQDGAMTYGIEFVWLDGALSDRIHDLVVGDRGSLDERWHRPR